MTNSDTRFFLHFAHAIQLDATRYSAEKEAAILVTAYNFLTIVIPASFTSPARYFDIPLNKISKTAIENGNLSQPNSDAVSTKSALVVRLSSGSESNVFQDAVGKNISEVALAFSDKDAAKDLEMSINDSIRRIAIIDRQREGHISPSSERVFKSQTSEGFDNCSDESGFPEQFPKNIRKRIDYHTNTNGGMSRHGLRISRSGLLNVSDQTRHEDGRIHAIDDIANTNHLIAIASLATNIQRDDVAFNGYSDHNNKQRIFAGTQNESNRISVAESPIGRLSNEESSVSTNTGIRRETKQSQNANFLSQHNGHVEVAVNSPSQRHQGFVTVDNVTKVQDVDKLNFENKKIGNTDMFSLRALTLPQMQEGGRGSMSPLDSASVSGNSRLDPPVVTKVRKDKDPRPVSVRISRATSGADEHSSKKVSRRMRDRQGEIVDPTVSQPVNPYTTATSNTGQSSRSNKLVKVTAIRKSESKVPRKSLSKRKSKGVDFLFEGNLASKDKEGILYEIPYSPPRKLPAPPKNQGKKKVVPKATMPNQNKSSRIPINEEPIRRSARTFRGSSIKDQDEYLRPKSGDKTIQRQASAISKAKQEELLLTVGKRLPKVTDSKASMKKRLIASVTPNRPVSRRIAAMQANRKIQGLAVHELQDEEGSASAAVEPTLNGSRVSELVEEGDLSIVPKHCQSDFPNVMESSAATKGAQPGGITEDPESRITGINENLDGLKENSETTAKRSMFAQSMDDRASTENPKLSLPGPVNAAIISSRLESVPENSRSDRLAPVHEISRLNTEGGSKSPPLDVPHRYEVDGRHFDTPSERVNEHFENAMQFFDDAEDHQSRFAEDQEGPSISGLQSDMAYQSAVDLKPDPDSVRFQELEPNLDTLLAVEAGRTMSVAPSAEFAKTGDTSKISGIQQILNPSVLERIELANNLPQHFLIANEKSLHTSDPLAVKLYGAFSGVLKDEEQRNIVSEIKYEAHQVKMLANTESPREISHQGPITHINTSSHVARVAHSNDRELRDKRMDASKKHEQSKDPAQQSAEPRDSPTLTRVPSTTNSKKARHQLQRSNKVHNSRNKKFEVISVSSSQDNSLAPSEDSAINSSFQFVHSKASKKRKSDTGTGRTQKKRRTEPITSTRIITPLRPVMVSRDLGSEVQMLDEYNYIHRKPSIIDFSAQGPLNQGVSLTRTSVHGPQPNNYLQPRPKSPFVVEKKRNIEKISGLTSKTDTLAEKRRKKSIEVITVEDSRSKTSTRSSSLSLIRGSRKPSSQSTKVNKNGSPMPSKSYIRGDETKPHIQNMTSTSTGVGCRVTTEQDRYDEEDLGIDIEEIGDESHSSLQNLDNMSPQVARRVVVHQSGFGKLLPSSPTAPSKMLEGIAAHRVHRSGKLVNVQTESIIRPVLPQDPFVGVSINPPNKFMQLLRASSGHVDQPLPKTTKGKQSARPRVSIYSPIREDPDKTLVELKSGPESNSSTRRSPYGNISPSSSPSDGDGAVNSLRQWRDALRPHQKDNLEVLTKIANVGTADFVSFVS